MSEESKEAIKRDDYKEKMSECVTNLSSLYEDLMLKKQIKKEEEAREKIKEIHKQLNINA